MLNSIAKAFFVSLYGLLMFGLGKYVPDAYYISLTQVGIIMVVLFVFILAFGGVK